ncbi:hypothetical protein CLAFUW4_13669 [Fulvia fulva]|uniref:Uncharacterized protein n=1 Tax=Passalora fulva TaxID=5499 RepID=A0A9Q8PL71_PASFU|nr:uncharacterized protein CLAFUR5_13518 [Fulvia fulva]KAK4610222.1 hypothetical protein CLAFUR4_13672 [Fulvia fulva]KAK4610988.1 hypothetical protein CLAFUR0_13676 [Fulvia fulva]UJO24424.1 hypothetical protein CLAFUR5_13518 [Fulvia fulva]WPV22374.1 hypothetical protein CLAFUW4_13669 [Fulvia fulva]WPV36797.1 hypothetical protein CLAFUW7_13677 [Fulvia fulva]
MAFSKLPPPNDCSRFRSLAKPPWLALKTQGPEVVSKNNDDNDDNDNDNINVKDSKMLEDDDVDEVGHTAM